MEITMMKAKNVMVGIKNGMTLDDFREKYQCTPDEFYERMKQLFGHNKKQLKSCVSQIEANQKKQRKETVSECAMDRVEGTEDADKAEVVESVMSKPVETSRNDELTYLIKFEKEQTQRVMDLESEHKGLAARHRQLKNSLRVLSDNIDRMMSEFQQYHQELDEILSQNATIEAQMNEITAKWATERTILHDTRRRIDNLSTVTLGVCRSGEIVHLDESKIELDDTGWQSARENLLMKDECQELRLKDIGTLARLLMIVEHLDYEVKIECDSSELEDAFKKLRG